MSGMIDPTISPAGWLDQQAYDEMPFLFLVAQPCFFGNGTRTKLSSGFPRSSRTVDSDHG